jgi:hypothetical protein
VCYSVAILAYSKNARLKTAADLHKILLQTTEKNATDTSEIVKVASGERKTGRKACQWFSKFNRGIPLPKTQNA